MVPLRAEAPFRLSNQLDARGRCQDSKTAFRSHCARPDGTLHTVCVREAFCPNVQPHAHARPHAGLTGLTSVRAAGNLNRAPCSPACV